ncbi:phosphocholine-specific phospholipase C [Arachidicoccus terrestris]|uniref:phosphocholine-specific phospholipase C n=1 Tax=Arachidicoccus terrestris TaxID=2875539 RepID=UPI001CC68376|nr:phospholipase C, phosphocholine-specific [Arachidicoccus terrestris]UAY55592.1 phospholipase C, phosphocholine-specific [Arachidicoccus terrestris]
MDSRREFLKKAMLLSGAAGVASSVPASIKKALAIDPEEGSDFYQAEHVVILMQENRAFDHCFGALRGVRGFNDPRVITLPDGNPVWLQKNKKGETYVPFRFSIEDSKITWMGSVPHSRASQVDANNLGKYDGWLEAKKSGNPQYRHMPLTLGHYNREDLPFNYALADAFTICDQHYCSAMTSTWPNRLYLWSGTIREEKNSDSKTYIRNEIPYGEARWTTMPEHLEKQGISWKVYQNDLSTAGSYKGNERAWLSNFGCNPLEFLAQYNIRFLPAYIKSLQTRAEKLQKEIKTLESDLGNIQENSDKWDGARATIKKKKEVLADARQQMGKWTKSGFEKLTAYQKALFYKAFTINDADPDYRNLVRLDYDDNGEKREVEVPGGDVLYQFRKDVDSGKLPAVSWLVPSQNFSDHPSAPWYGTWLTSEILDILTKNPEVWKKTIFILTYDENDGYFDHVPPYVAPDPENPLTGAVSPDIRETAAEQVRLKNELRDGINKKGARGGPIGLGFRVPMIIASPWTRGGKVCSQVLDHTSPLQFLEKFVQKKFGKKIVQDTITDWRRAVCGDLTAAFTKFEKAGKEPLPFLDRDQFVQRIYNAKFKKEPTGYKALTDEEIKEIILHPEASKWMPAQEPGVRPSLALPYELYADGMFSKTDKKIGIQMKAGKQVFGTKAAGAPFMVYAHGGYLTEAAERGAAKDYEPVRVWHFAVTAGSELNHEWPLECFSSDQYDLRLYGPNGFYRGLKGSLKDPAIHMSLQYEPKRMMSRSLTGNLVLKLRNADSVYSQALEIVDNAYGKGKMQKRLGAGAQTDLVISLKDSQGWYDFTIKVTGNDSFERRYAGRVETGKPSVSDPQMAGKEGRKA